MATLDTIAVAAMTPAPRRTGRLSAVLRDPRTLVGLVMLVVILAIAFVGPLIAPYPIDKYVGAPYSPPSGATLLGTDFMGRDVLSRTLNGGLTVVWMSLVAATIGVVLGALIGMIAGYARGWVDEVLMRLSDVALALPTIVFVLLFVSVFGRNLWLLVILIGLSHAPQVARVVRGATVDVREREFVESAEALGASSARILLTQVTPNITGTLMVEYGLRIVWSIAALASLSVLGQGMAAPAADWGLMINENRGGLTFQPWGVVAPLICIALFALAANLLTEGVGRALDLAGERRRS